MLSSAAVQKVYEDRVERSQRTYTVRLREALILQQREGGQLRCGPNKDTGVWTICLETSSDIYTF
jgi:hypothetical protein